MHTGKHGGGGASARTYRLAFLGLGNVGRTLVRLLMERESRLRDERGIEWIITGVASRRLGWQADASGLDRTALVEGDIRASTGQIIACDDVDDWLSATKPDVVFETIALDPHHGEPALSYLRASMQAGAHAISANKGPVVHGYEELTSLAAAQGRRYLFESAVMDGVPIFSLFRDAMPLAEVRGFRGILNSTTNVILGGIEEGLSFADSLARAQAAGVAEADASYDIEGWDAALKTAALVRVLMGVKLELNSITREGIAELCAHPEEIRAARTADTPYKLVCEARRVGNSVFASARPEKLASDDPLARVSGTSSAIQFETDVLPGLALYELSPGLEITAYGLLADFLRAVS